LQKSKENEWFDRFLLIKSLILFMDSPTQFVRNKQGRGCFLFIVVARERSERGNPESKENILDCFAIILRCHARKREGKLFLAMTAVVFEGK
jgi:hypothetical protein